MQISKYGHITKYLSFIFAVTFFLFTMNSCGTAEPEELINTTESVSVKAGTIQLYHIEGTKVVPDTERYQLLQPDNPSSALEEIVEQLTLTDGLSIERFLMDANGNVNLFIKVSANIPKDQLLLSKAAIVRSIQGIDVDEIAITLQDVEGNAIETASYTDASFYYYNE